MKTLKTWAAVAAMVALTSTAQAALVNQGNGTVLDTTTNLIWLQDWNGNGDKTWATQIAWAQSLSFAGSSGWVLPSISDYATLFAEVGDLTVVTEFTNVQPNLYWSGTEDILGVIAWCFVPDIGFQCTAIERIPMFAVAVRPGDVAAAVPEPQTLALALLALSAAAVARRRRPR